MFPLLKKSIGNTKETMLQIVQNSGTKILTGTKELSHYPSSREAPMVVAHYLTHTVQNPTADL